MSIWAQCAGSKWSINNTRGYGWGIASQGFEPLFRRMAAVSDGKKALLHLPFGRTFREGANGMEAIVMDFDAQLRLEYEGLIGQVQSLEKNLHILKDSFEEVIIYIGGQHNCNRMKWMLANDRLDSWLWVFWRCLDFALEHKCSVAIDNAASLSVDSLTASALITLGELLAKHNRTVYIESTTEYTSLLFDKFPMLIADRGNINNRHLAPQHPGAVNRFPVVGTERWYKQKVHALLFDPDYVGQKEKLDLRINELRSHGIDSFVPFQLAERFI